MYLSIYIPEFVRWMKRNEDDTIFMIYEAGVMYKHKISDCILRLLSFYTSINNIIHANLTFGLPFFTNRFLKLVSYLFMIITYIFIAGFNPKCHSSFDWKENTSTHTQIYIHEKRVTYTKHETELIDNNEACTQQQRQK